jgi:predicted nucleic acid-binding protein
VILVDISVWVDHLRKGESALARLLNTAQVLTHPFVIGELALGILRQRDLILATLHDLPQAAVASQQEVLHFIGAHRLSGAGIGLVDAHLLAATRLTGAARLWTRDKRLLEAAERLGLAASPRDQLTQS